MRGRGGPPMNRRVPNFNVAPTVLALIGHSYAICDANKLAAAALDDLRGKVDRGDEAAIELLDELLAMSNWSES